MSSTKTNSDRGPDVPQLTIRQRLIYGCGGVLDAWGHTGIKQTAGQVLNLTLAIDPALIGIVLALSRVWDAFTDPPIAAFSDNLRWRWGRRRPMIIVGALTCGVTFPLFWMVPGGMSSTVTAAWLLGALMLFYICYTTFGVPYYALGCEIAHTPQERTRLFAMPLLFTTITGLLTAWVFPAIQSGWFGNPQESTVRLAWMIGALTAVLGVLPGIFLQEGDARQVAAQRKVPVREALQQTLRCDPFMRISAAAGLNMLGLQMVNGFGTYVLIYHVFGGDMLRAGVMSGIQYAVSAVIVLLLTPSMVVLGRRVGKRRAFELSMLCGVAACVAKWFCYTPSAPWLVIAIVAFTAPATTMSVVFANSMVADVCAYEAKRTGLQLEGTYMAVLAWIRKFSMALSALASGFMLNLSGFEVGLGSHQSSGTVLALRLFFSFFPVASYLASWWLVRKYELPEVESSTR